MACKQNLCPLGRTSDLGNIEQRQIANSMESVITEIGNYDMEIQKRFGIAEIAFQNPNEVFQDRKISVETKKNVPDFYLILIFHYGCGVSKISSDLER